ncbi:hypothetical protein [Acuticoccus sediminis]|uniref:hypothetical protein n=1 Tax=Acuticoccus sediminis TaxID=2184697 RepID=UPI001CFE53AD|nr:hypothetical protein [Acuticoccus sediminis]
MSNELATTQQGSVAELRPRREAPQVLDPIPVLDTARFEHMQRIAQVMVHSSLLPESLTHVGTKDRKEQLPLQTITANAFLITNQAVRWGMDPFAVVQSCSVVHGKLCYEGKLVAGVLDAKLGIKLHCWFTGAGDAMRVFVSDVPFTDGLVERLAPGVQIPGIRMIDGCVSDWKTTGNNSPWSAKNYQRQLRYRGTREWARAFEPALLLGVYTEDEMASLQARDVTPRSRLSLAQRLSAPSESTASDGFGSAIHYDPDTGEITEAQQDGPGLYDRAPAEASAKASRERGAGAAPAPVEERPPHTNTGENIDEGPSPDATQHASDDGLPAQEESHVDDRATSTLEGDGAAGAASSPQDDDPSVIDEFAAEVAEARSVEQLQQLRQDWKDRIYAAGAQDQARKLYARRSKELAEAAGAEAGR